MSGYAPYTGSWNPSTHSWDHTDNGFYTGIHNQETRYNLEAPNKFATNMHTGDQSRPSFDTQADSMGLAESSVKPSWLSSNMGNIKAGFGIAKGLADMYNANRTMKLAKDQFKTEKQYAGVNLYNTAQGFRQSLDQKHLSNWQGSDSLRDQYGGDQEKYLSEQRAKYEVKDKV